MVGSSSRLASGASEPLHGPRVGQEDLVFNAVYVPGSFRYLHPFLESLLATSGIGVRIVANGCRLEELDLMHRVAESYPDRVEVLSYSTDQRIEHGEVLNALYELDRDRRVFCFVDTDVMATGPWIEPFLDALTTCAGVSSAHPSWDPDPRAPASEPGLRGHYAFGSEGFLFGTSYLALYHRDRVDEIRERWGVDFRRVVYAELSPACQRHLDRIGRSYTFYDTAKALNALLQLDGYEVDYVDDVPLVHIGAMSILDFMTSTPYEQWPSPGKAAEVADKCARDTAEIAVNLAVMLIEWVDGHRPPPAVAPISDPEREQWLARTAPEIRRVVERFASRIPSAGQ